MALTPGTRLGSYEVVTLLGAGGMGEVYRARDPKLSRDVAIKVLLPAVANDPDRLARFSREAQVFASLNHPNIAHIYAVEGADGQAAALPYIAMELVEGEDLAQRIARGPIPIDEALPIARQIAEALEAAHDHGIIHRDLKPANIKVRTDTTVKVLDFGLAKSVDPTAGSSAAAMNSPTLSIHATQAGIILGTAAYMSPEQARGKPVDKRTDTWALGCVLFEMLAGARAFPGDDATDTIVAVVSKDPNWNKLPPAVSPEIHRLLRRLLEKDPRRRLDSAVGIRLDIDDALAASPNDRAVSAASKLRVPLLPWGAAVGLAIALVAIWRGADREPSAPVFASLDAPPGFVMGDTDAVASLPSRAPMVFTPDGRSLVMQAARDGQPQLFLRSLDRPDARPIAGTEGARGPFMSPDGKWIGFWVANDLKKVPIDGGSPTTICTTPLPNGPNGGSWGAGDMIVFGDEASRRIMRVSAIGGVPVAVTTQPPPAGNRQHVAPYFLPDGRRVLFSDVSNGDAADARVMVQSLDGGESRLVVASATDARLLPSGHLAFMRLGTLMTVAFDVASASTIGEAAVAMSGVMQSGTTGLSGTNNTGAGIFAVSSLGTLAMVRGALSGPAQDRLAWVTSDGHASSAEPASGKPAGGLLNTRISPDGTVAAVAVQTPMRREVWFADWKRNLWTPCDDCGSERGYGRWSPDGRKLLLGREGTIVAHVLDRSAPSQVVVREADRSLLPMAWLADGRILYLSSPDQTNYEIKFLEPGDTAGRVVVALGMGADPDVSRDGRWLAYTSTQTAQRNVIVQAFPGPGSRTQVSAGGGNPAWSSDGRTLYYLRHEPGQAGVTVLSVAIDTRPVLAAGAPRELFRHPERQGCTPARCFDVSADGERFLFREKAEKRESVTRMDLVLNWAETLPTGR